MRLHSLAVVQTSLLVLLASATDAAPPERPNFVVINIDDLGYADIGPFGSQLNRTPALDRMAEEGRRLTSFYAAPVCSPSRAALMTGCYPKRALPIPHVLFPANDVGLAPAEVTVAEVLKQVGYTTAIVGKWHLGDQPEFLPLQQGFDHYLGLPYSNDMGPAADGVKSDLGKPLPKPPANGPGQPPLPLMRDNTVLRRVLPDDQQSLVELYTDEAVQFLQDHRDGPFFLYLPHNAVHFPLYPGKRWVGHSSHGLYSDWVEEVDWSVGRVLDTIRELGISERTLVIFTSDNGGTQRGSNAPLRGHKGSTFEGGVRVPTIAWWPGQVPAGTSSGEILGMFDILPTLAALAGSQAPTDRRIDGVNIWPQLSGDDSAPAAHETFYYYRGLRLEAVRQGAWKLQLAPANKPEQPPRLYNLREDIGETLDVAEGQPEVVERLRQLVAEMEGDLGLDGQAPGSRPLGRVERARPLIDHDGTFRTSLAPPTFKVFVLAGQSNMEGKAPNALLEHQAGAPETRALFAHLRRDGQWVERDDVFIKFLERHGPLTIGYGSRDRTGAELEFGTMMGERFAEPVLLIKTAWGGHSLFKSFRPPSAGLPSDERLDEELRQAQERVRKENERRGRNDPAPTLDELKQAYGASYREMLKEVRETLEKRAELFPALADLRPELAGFVWFQGWNDQYGAQDEYASNLTALIHDIRRDLDAPALPVVIAAMGQNGSTPAKDAMATVQAAQMSMNDIAEFRGNVRAFRTDLLVDRAAEELYPHWRERQEEWKLVGGDFAYHYLGSAIWFQRIGHAMGESMLQLIDGER